MPHYVLVMGTRTDMSFEFFTTSTITFHDLFFLVLYPTNIFLGSIVGLEKFKAARMPGGIPRG